MPIDYSKWDRLAASLGASSEEGSSGSESEELESDITTVPPGAMSEAEAEKWQLRLFLSQHPCPGTAEVTEWAQDALHAGLLDTTEEPLRAGVVGCGYDAQHFDYLAFRRMWEAVGQDTEKEMQRAVGEMLSTKGLRCMQLNYYVFRFALRGQYFYGGPKPLAVRSHPRILEFWWDGIGEWRV